MRRILRAKFDEVHLFPRAVEDWVGAQHPARFIREFVENLDLRELDVAQPDPEVGGVCYGSELLLSVWLFGYWRRIRTTRKLEDACRSDVGFIWLSGNHQPDHHALWRFWNANKAAVRTLFKKTVIVAMKLELVEMVTQAIDGTKILAACTQWGSYDREHNALLLERLEKVIDDLEKQIETESADNQRRAELNEDLGKQQVLREKVRHALDQIEEEGRKHVHPQEPTARRMKTPGKNRFSYNAQAVVDGGGESIVTTADVVVDENDKGLLAPMMEQAKEVTGKEASRTLADNGYFNSPQIAAAQKQSSSALYVPLSRPMQNAEHRPFHCNNFHWDSERDVVVCPQGKDLKFHHARKRKGQEIRVYRDITACADCPVRAQCTKDRHGRSIDVSPHWQEVNAHREHMATEESKEIFKQRAGIIERVFAHIKGHWGFTRWTAKGLSNVRAQWQMLCATWNLSRIFIAWQDNSSAFKAAVASA
jgi:transposase